jgi:hypothetical protein
MKITKLVAAIGLVTATLGMGTAVNAQQHRVIAKRTVVTRHTSRAPVRVVHRKVVHRQVCRTVLRHHRHVRVCR